MVGSGQSVMSLLVELFALMGALILGVIIADFIFQLALAVKAHLLPRFAPTLPLDAKFGPWAARATFVRLDLPEPSVLVQLVSSQVWRPQDIHFSRLLVVTAVPDLSTGVPTPTSECQLVVNIADLSSVLTGLLLPQLDYWPSCGVVAGAVVTGCTDGIGRAYVEELAKRGLNIVLISRSEEKLRNVSAHIESKYQVKTKIITVDFSKGQQVYYQIEAELKGIHVGILVNNVGKQHVYPTYFGEVPEQELWDIINVNIGATTLMTKLILPQMVSRKQGAIVNVSSSSELQPLPLMTVYAATKIFVKSFSEALRVEYQSEGITIQHLSPFFVNTKMNAFSYRLQESSLLVPDAETYAWNAINTLGRVNHTTGYWAHGLQYFFTMIPPMWLRTYIGAFMNQIFRKDYLYNNKSISFL